MQVGLSQILRVPPDTAHSTGSRDSLPAQTQQTAPRTDVPGPVVIPPSASNPSPSGVVVKIQAPGTADVTRVDGLIYSSKGLIARAPEGMPLEPDGATASTQSAADFVSHAVSAMRQFTDDAERRKRYALLDSAVAAQAPVDNLSGLKRLSARFSLFA